jgi:acyl-CoA synthetase (NDP forming)
VKKYYTQIPRFGRIPNFEGAEKAAKLLTTLPEWERMESKKERIHRKEIRLLFD